MAGESFSILAKIKRSSAYICGMNIPSKLIENAVNAFATLPGIGRKTALRLALHLLNTDAAATETFTEAIGKMRREVKFCRDCHNVSDAEQCTICLSARRDRHTICVVESLRDLLAIENTGQYGGLYHILGGVISPMEGIGPNELNIDTLVERLRKGETKELVMALNATIEGDATIFYISKQMAEFDVKISTIARGVSFGGELEYADELTLGRSIVARTDYRMQ